MTREEIIQEFHKIYYDEGNRSSIINSTRWMGVLLQKCPLDLWIYQEIMFEVRPTMIIETGSLHGGSGLWFAHMLDIIHGSADHFVLSIDINADMSRPDHYSVLFKQGSSVLPEIIQYVSRWVEKYKTVMVVLDSDHRANHVYQELELYSKFVTPGSYLILEDTNINGHPVLNGWGAGPMEALEAWLPKHPEFEVDKSREKLLCTMNPGGFLRRKIC